MTLRKCLGGLLACVLLIAPMLRAETVLEIKLRVFAGTQYTGPDPDRVVTASYLKPTVSANIETDFELAKVERQIKRVFNLIDITLLTEADLSWNSREAESVFHFFRLNGHEYFISFTPTSDWEEKREFRIGINEAKTADPKKTKNVLRSSFTLPAGNIVVFGFESAEGKPYYLSVHLSKTSYNLIGGDAFSKGAVRAVGEIKPPRLIKKVDPIYPEAARRDTIQGVVILGCRTNEQGEVEAVEIYRSVDPLLDQAAVEAVMQWKYEPLFIDDQARKVVFTVTVRFKLRSP